METAQSFTARRSAASNLPQFQLPPPDHLSGMHKFPAYAPSSTTPSAPNVSAVPTPPVGLPSDGLSPLASSVNSGSSGSSAAGVPPYQPMGYWPTPQNPSYSYSSAPPMSSPYAQQQQQAQSYGGRPLYSPMSFGNRNAPSPATGEGLPPPPYDLSLPPFPTSMGSGGGGPQQHQQHQHQHQQHQHQQQQPSLPQLAPQHQSQPNMPPGHHPSSQPPQQSPLHAPDAYAARPPPTPAYYNSTPSSTPQQGSFPAYVHQSPTQSPNATSGPSRISPISAQSHPSMSAPQGYHRPYGGYNLPAMAGPIMSNVHSPGNQMALVGGMSMQYPQHHQMGGPMYGHPNQQAPPNDRPFKCDQCPQSFNRNHDLKRHKRIHLAVKPFPCNHCDKSFSRKDALKRHILVKGCGNKNAANGAPNATGGSQSPVERSEILSDSAGETSPQLIKKDL